MTTTLTPQEADRETAVARLARYRAAETLPPPHPMDIDWGKPPPAGL